MKNVGWQRMHRGFSSVLVVALDRNQIDSTDGPAGRKHIATSIIAVPRARSSTKTDNELASSVADIDTAAIRAI